MEIGKMIKNMVFFSKKIINFYIGWGIYKWPDNKIYKGFWKKDRRKGYGKFFWPDGYCYLGNWKNDNKNGKGLFIWKVFNYSYN